MHFFWTQVHLKENNVSSREVSAGRTGVCPWTIRHLSWEQRHVRLSRIAGALQEWLGWKQARGGPVGGHPRMWVGEQPWCPPHIKRSSKSPLLFQHNQQTSHTHLSSQLGAHLSCADGQGWHVIPEVWPSLWDRGKEIWLELKLQMAALNTENSE